MTPPPIVLAHALAPRLEGLRWAIGAGSLLHLLGLEPQPRDLDLVTVPDDFAAMAQRLASWLGPGVRPASTQFQSDQFLRFVGEGGVDLDLMAGIAVRRAGRVVRFEFDPARVQWFDGLPGMDPQDWLRLYALFDRPQRVAQLRRYLHMRQAVRGGGAR